MFIFASMKDWNKESFDKILQNSNEQGIYVSSTKELEQALIKFTNPSWVFFAHWSNIIPKKICDNINGVIFHCTDLPYGRGGSPLQNLILLGHTKTKLTAIRLSEKIDSGNILIQSDLSLEGNASQIFKRISLILVDQCIKLLANDYCEKPQSGDIVYFKRRKPEESNIMSNQFNSINDFYNFIRMLDCETYPRAYIEKSGYQIEFSEANYITQDELECKVRISKNKT